MGLVRRQPDRKSGDEPCPQAGPLLGASRTTVGIACSARRWPTKPRPPGPELVRPGSVASLATRRVERLREQRRAVDVLQCDGELSAGWVDIDLAEVLPTFQRR